MNHAERNFFSRHTTLIRMFIIIYVIYVLSDCYGNLAGAVGGIIVITFVFSHFSFLFPCTHKHTHNTYKFTPVHTIYMYTTKLATHSPHPLCSSCVFVHLYLYRWLCIFILIFAGMASSPNTNATRDPSTFPIAFDAGTAWILQCYIEQGSKDHSHNPQQPKIEEKVFTDDELVALIDPILKMDDTSKDGFIDYPEFIRAQEKAAANQQQQQQQKQQH